MTISMGAGLIFSAVLAFFLIKLVIKYFAKKGEIKAEKELTVRLKQRFPEYSSEFTNESARKMITLFNQHLEYNKIILHDKSVADKESRYLKIKDNLANFMSPEFCKNLSEDKIRGETIHAVIWNSIMVGRNAPSRYWVDEHGKTHITDDKNVPSGW